MTIRPTSQQAVSPYNIVLKGSGTPSADNTNFANAVSAAQDGDVIWVQGSIQLTGPHTITNRISIAGLTPDAEIIADPAVVLTFGTPHNPFSAGTPKTMSSETYGSGKFTSADLGASQGDWVVCYSQDGLGVRHSNIPSRSMEIHQIADVSGTTYYLSNFFSDKYTVSQACQLWTPTMRNVKIADIRFSWNGNSIDSTQRIIVANGVDHLEIYNCQFGDVSPGGGIQLNNCTNAKVTGCTFANPQNYDLTVTGRGYHVLICGGNGILVTDNVFHGGRHGITTASSAASGTSYRAGTVRGLIVANNVFRCMGIVSGSALIPIDTHAEGYGILIQNNLVELNPHQVNIGINARARNTIIKGNTIAGAPKRENAINTTNITKGIRILGAPNCYVEGNTIRNMLFGLDYLDLAWQGALRSHVHGNKFISCSGPGIYCSGGYNHNYDGNYFEDCGVVPGNGVGTSCIEFNAGDIPGLAWVTGNTFMQKGIDGNTNETQYSCYHRQGNLASVTSQTMYAGNRFLGWGADSCGFGAADPYMRAQLETVFGPANIRTNTQPSGYPDYASGVYGA